jgi:energy-coupling factor transport system ATP-binding protein
MDGPPAEIFTHVDELRGMGLTVPDTVALLYDLRQEGVEVPLDALTVEACADVIAEAFSAGA